jgi:hypothetical protein
MAELPFVYGIIEQNGHSAVLHQANDWEGTSVQLTGSTPEGGKARVTARELCDKYSCPIIDLRQSDNLPESFPLCLDVFVGYKGPQGLRLNAYIKWFVDHDIRVWMPKKAPVQSPE